MTLSVVMPAFRCGDTIVRDIAALERVLSQITDRYEIIVVADGQVDDTFARASTLASGRVVVTGYPVNRGKGFAVIYGMRLARGQYVGFMDAGGDIRAEAWRELVALLQREQADIVIGSKQHPRSVTRLPAIRRLYSYGYQQLIRVLFRVNVRDTQTGIKVFRREVIEAVAPLLLVKRFAFDIELLALARHLGYGCIVEAPVVIEHQFASSVNVRAVFRTLWDTVAVFYRLYIRHYYDHLQQQQRAAAASLRSSE